MAYAEATTCRRQRLLANFGETMPAPCGNCDNCINPPLSFDGSVLAQKALSCVFRTDQRYGVGHLTNVLRGAADERVQALGHDRLSTFGVGVDLDVSQWRAVFRQLVAGGLLATDEEGYGVLRLTAASRNILRGEASVQLRRPADRSLRRAAKRGQRSEGKRQSLDIADQETPLWNRLRATRARLAREQGVPAYVIFHDATLLQMLRARPRNADELGAVSGIGAAKLTRYGEVFLRGAMQRSMMWDLRR